VSVAIRESTLIHTKELREDSRPFADNSDGGEAVGCKTTATHVKPGGR
jgi:hypothetical protein